MLNTDGLTILPVCSDVGPTLHYLCVSAGTTGQDYGPANAARDENRIPVAMAVSSADGTTPVALYVDSDRNLLIQTS